MATILAGGTAGSAATTGGEAPSGDAGESGAPSGAVDLCLKPEEIPANWSAGGTANGSSTICAVGQPGQFLFDGCRYELLDATPHDVDPFLGGRSPCCYRSTLVSCP